jgi:hypothetical protein
VDAPGCRHPLSRLGGLDGLGLAHPKREPGQHQAGSVRGTVVGDKKGASLASGSPLLSAALRCLAVLSFAVARVRFVRERI